jgi:hypothetical protein
MNKRFGAAAVIALYAVFATVQLVHGQDELKWAFSEWRKWWDSEKMVRGSVYFEVGVYRDFVGIKHDDDQDLWNAAHLVWMGGPAKVVNIIHPDPNVDPAIVRWMKQNGVNKATTPVNGRDFRFIVIRDNGDGTYSTLYYTEGR